MITFSQPMTSLRCHWVWLLAAVGLAYANAWPAAFQFDDFNVIVDNPAVHSWQDWLASMPGIRPLLKLSYVFNWTSGWGVTGFHAFNVLVHGVNAGLVHALLRRWTLSSGLPGEAALLAALLFALHPAQTEAVTYISGRSVSLMAMFYLSAMLLWLGGRRAWAALAMLMALAVKETAWTLPFALLLWQCAEGKSLRASARGLLPLWSVLVAALLAMLAIPGYRRLLAGSLAVRGIGDNLIAQVEGQFYLLTHPLFMLHVNIDPEIPVPAEPGLGGMLKALILIGGMGYGFRALWRQRWAGLAILWFFLHLLPTNSLLPRADIANDRQLYLALIGPGMLLTWWTFRMRLAYLRRALVVGLIAVLGGATVLRNQDYRTEVRLWRATVEVSPGKARVWNNLGYAYRLEGNFSQAKAAYRRALEIDPDDIQSRANLMALERE